MPIKRLSPLGSDQPIVSNQLLHGEGNQEGKIQQNSEKLQTSAMKL